MLAACSDDSGSEDDIDMSTSSDDLAQDDDEYEAEEGQDASADEAPAADDETAPDPVNLGDAGVEINFTGEGVECGSETCYDAELVGLAGLVAAGCCAAEETSSCGLNMAFFGQLLSLNDPGCEELDRAGELDDACPASEPVAMLIPGAPAEGVTMEGCCQANGVCGYWAHFGSFGFGCVDPERFSQESGVSCDAPR